jgi:hypothetical protein
MHVAVIVEAIATMGKERIMEPEIREIYARRQYGIMGSKGEQRE